MFNYKIQNILTQHEKTKIPPLQHSFNEVLYLLCSQTPYMRIHNETKTNLWVTSLFFSVNNYSIVLLHMQNGKNGHGLEFSEYGPASF